jgi:arylsulfatase A-like enzyme
MDIHLNRREFLKLSSLLPLAYFATKSGRQINNPPAQNVLIIVFDAWSAYDVSLYGYHRDTMPRLARIVDHATVYHNHFAGSSFTSPGTAALLTGGYPFSTRAFKVSSKVNDLYQPRNIFSLFDSDQYFRIAYTHNPLAESLLRQFRHSMDFYVPRKDLYLGKSSLITQLLNQDWDIASLAEKQILDNSDGVTNSLFLSPFTTAMNEKKKRDIVDSYAHLFPRGTHNLGTSDYFILEDGIDYLMKNLNEYPQPYLGYFHFYPPHEPYNSRREFIDKYFNDGWEPIAKPLSFLETKGWSRPRAIRQRNMYDEFIAYVDAEFERLYQFMHAANLLGNTWVVLTSDHGEMFERGNIGHSNHFLNQPVIRIPLIIFQPGQQERVDVYSPTSAVDVLPTLLHVTGHPVPDWCEGEVLPPYRDAELDRDRSIFGIVARNNPPHEPISMATAMIVKGQYKLLYYFGFPELPDGEPFHELFDLDNDPQELNDLSSSQSSIARELLNELKTRLDAADEPYS